MLVLAEQLLPMAGRAPTSISPFRLASALLFSAAGLLIRRYSGRFLMVVTLSNNNQKSLHTTEYCAEYAGIGSPLWKEERSPWRMHAAAAN